MSVARNSDLDGKTNLCGSCFFFSLTSATSVEQTTAPTHQYPRIWEEVRVEEITAREQTEVRRHCRMMGMTKMTRYLFLCSDLCCLQS